MEQALLVIDDDYELIDSLRKILPPSEAKMIPAFDYQSGSRVVARQKFSTVVLNPLLPGTISGFDFLEDLRATLPMPILAIGNATSEERIKAYYLGADLFLQKPLNPSELAAAIRALLRRYLNLNRAAEHQAGGLALHCKDLVLSSQRRTVQQRGQPVVLSPKEFDILYFLASNPGIVFSKETLYERVWKAEFPFGNRCVTDHISSIRRKLGRQTDDESYIQTVYGVGYRFRL